MIIDYIAARQAEGQSRSTSAFWEPERDSKYVLHSSARLPAQQSDQELADAVRRAGNVVLLADAVDAGIDDGEVDADSSGVHRLSARSGD